MSANPKSKNTASSLNKDFVEKMRFVEKWAEFVREHPDTEWSSLQKTLIDSQLENAKQVKLTKEQVEKIKKKN